MRTVMMAVCLLAASVAQAHENPLRTFEVDGVGSLADGPGYASRSPQGSLRTSIGTRWLRAVAEVSYASLHKVGTTGGFQRGVGFGGEVGAHNVFLLGGRSSNFTDQTDYTKFVVYWYAGAGYRWASGWRGDRAVNITDARFVTYREARSTYANHTSLYTASVSWDHMLDRALYVRLALRVGAMYFDDNPYPGAARRRGTTSTYSVGLVLRP